jgi:hypothetical protein
MRTKVNTELLACIYEALAIAADGGEVQDCAWRWERG